MNKLTFFISLFVVLSCSAQKNPKDSLIFNNKLSVLKLDKGIIKIIKEYKKTRRPNSVVFVSFKNKIKNKKNTYYVNTISNLSSLYDYYITGYFFLDSIPVILSSKKDGFVDVNNYSKSFISMMVKYLNDDMLMNSIEIYNDNSLLYEVKNVFILNHSEIWKVRNSKIHKNWKKHPVYEKVLIRNKSLHIDNYYRVVKGGRDDRLKIKKSQ